MSDSASREKRRYRLGLLPKTVGITVLVVAPVTFALARTATRQLEAKLTSQFESKGEAIALSLAFATEASRESLSKGVAAVQGLIDAGTTIDGVAYIYIQDHEGSIVAHTFRPTFPPNFEETNWVDEGELTGKRVKIAPAVRLEMADSRVIDSIDIAAPIDLGRRGVVHVGMDRAEIDHPVAALRGTMLAAAGGIGGAGIVFGALLITLWIVQPVRVLRRAVVRIAETGDLSQDVAQSGSGEIGDLVGSFRSMLADLRRSRAEVAEYNRTLTERVEERTREVDRQKDALEKANRDLRRREEAQELYARALRVFNEATTLDVLLREGLNAVATCTGGLLGAVHLLEEGGERLRTAATLGVRTPPPGSFELGEGLAGRAAVERVTVTTRGVADPSWGLGVMGSRVGPCELLAVPMLVPGALVGVVELAAVEGPFREDRRSFLDTLAGQFAIAITNMRSNLRTRALAAGLEETNRQLLQQSSTLSRQREELDQKNHALERASKAKSDFLASMSHELRTPMNSIIGYTDLVLARASTLEPKLRRNLERVLSNAHHLLALVNDVLDLSKIEAGRMDLFFEDVDAGAILEHAATTSEVLVRDKPVKIVREVSPDLRQIRTDKTKLRQVVLNVLSNACKFTEQGEIRLRAAPIQVGGRPGLRVVVQDTGIGIAPSDLPTVFEEFRQVGEVGRRHAGTGLGLALVKKIVDLMGGTVGIESELGAGTCTTITLPIEAPAGRESDRPGRTDVAG